MHKLILASSSPRRQTYFKEMGLNYKVFSPNIDETPFKGEKPKEYVKRIAFEKAKTIHTQHTAATVVAADTIVAVGRRILGKPKSKKEAETMLRLMSGRRHQVLSSVCVIDENGFVHACCTKTAVKIKLLSENDIKCHVDKEENWHGKSGGYGIQTTSGGLIVKSIVGSHSGVVGMPLVETSNILRSCGFEF